MRELMRHYNHVVTIYDVYGADGHRQRASFGESTVFHTTSGSDIVCLCEEDTHTNEYVRMIIYSPDKLIAKNELEMQLTDGVFENCRVGAVVEQSASYDDALFEVIIKTYNWGVDRYEAIDIKKVEYNCTNDVADLISSYAESDDADLIEFEVNGVVPMSYRVMGIGNWLFELHMKGGE